MSQTQDIHPPPDSLDAVNAALADVFHVAPLSLTCGAARALGDSLVVCGILGGKDVGKSTLINALAQRDVSVDDEEVGEGTRRPMAYVHRDARPGVATRLAAIEAITPIDVTEHEADAVRNVVLIDLPDFDSEFTDHQKQVKAVAPLLDRVLWVMTPRKVGDRLWAGMFRRVIKDPDNVHCVLNKLDELLTDADPFEGGNGHPADAFWRSQHAWLAESLASAGCAQSDEHRFVIAAKYVPEDEFAARIAWLWDDLDWEKYDEDRESVVRVARLARREFERLRAAVMSPVSEEEAAQIKQANERVERRVNADAVRAHYRLDESLELLGGACDAAYQQSLLNAGFGPEYCAAVGAKLFSRLPPTAELAHELLERRVADWPVLSVVYRLFGWLPRLLGRRFSSTAEASPDRIGDDAFRIDGASLPERIDALRSRLLDEQSVVVERLRIADDRPSTSDLVAQAAAALAELGAQMRERFLEGIHGDQAPSKRWQRAAIWVVLIWFPLVQPVLEGVLEMAALQGTLSVLHGLYRVVAALGAARLLAGLAVVAAVYVVILTAMFTRALRDVRTARQAQSGESPLADRIDAVLLHEVLAPMIEPFRAARDRLSGLADKLSAMTQ
ncbi:MAG: hypothetical protein C4547_04365 [Phycisphaerales bacterium]|nr:MAG: hypothetical protein C4547_04365 [Phycisphaerales bacterium]